jgi:phenylpropionate dioxygenase-like ring-hydroxylating dioxygenase large terminal subunit
MSGFLDDRAVAERVLGHIRERTTDRGTEIWREPVANYRSSERLAQEIAVLRRFATPFCPSAALPEVGSYVAREAAGIPLLAVRGGDGRVRVFRNACRHRGTQLASGAGCAAAFVCPYHGWTYHLDGRLRHIPHEDGFPGLDRAQHGLMPVTAEERLGLVFVAQDGGSPCVAPWEGLPQLVASEQQLMDSTEREVDVNWKVSLEGFIEGYHIRSTHRDTFYPYGFDNLTLLESCGPHSRVTYPFRRIEKLAGTPVAERRVEGRLTYVYHLFPNALVTVLSHHTNLVVLEPVAVDRTRMVTYVLTNRSGTSDTRAAERDQAFVNRTGAAEDLAIVRAIQRSIGSGANEHFTFGHFESAIAHFHRTLAAMLEAAGDRAPARGTGEHGG